MAKSVVLIAPAEVTLDRIHEVLKERVAGECTYVPGNEPQVHLQLAENGQWYVTFAELNPVEDVRLDYEENDEIPESIRKALPGKHFIAISFNDYRFCASVMRHLLSGLASSTQSIWLDNDYGVLIPAGRVVAELDADLSWDWTACRPDDVPA